MGLSFGMSSVLLASIVLMRVTKQIQGALIGNSLWGSFVFFIIAILLLLSALLLLILTVKLLLALPILIDSLFDQKGTTARQAFRQANDKLGIAIGYVLLIGLLYTPAVAITFVKIPVASAISMLYRTLVPPLFYLLLP